MTPQAILFDIDGTLVDSNDAHILAWERAFAEAGYGFDRQTIHDQIGKGTDMLVPTLLPDSDEAEQTALGEAHGRIFKADYLDAVRPFSGARDLIARVHGDGRRAVLASSASKAELDHYIGLIGVRDLIDAGTSADDVERTKPAPDIFATALGRIAPLSPDAAIVLGDTPYDMEAARRCGIPAIGLRSGGFTDAALAGAGAMAIYDDVAALLADYDESPLAAR